MENFIQCSNDADKQILMKYVLQCKFPHIGITILSYATSLAFIIGTFFGPNLFPTDAVYPFPVNNTYIIIFIYLLQSLTALETSAAILIDCLVAVLIWFVSARLEMLALSISNCNNHEELKACIKQHQNLLRYCIKKLCISREIVFLRIN
jgi:hypothetical protein